MGSGEFQQKMETEQNLIELSNKEMSAEIKKAQLLLNNLEMSNLNDFIFPLDINNYSENISWSDFTWSNCFARFTNRFS